MSKKNTSLELFAQYFAKRAGSGAGFLLAMGSLAVWFIAGIYVDFSENWQNWIQIYIAVITFLMVFLIQRAQNKEIATLQVKMDELIVADAQADSHLVNTEELSEKELQELHKSHQEKAKK